MGHIELRHLRYFAAVAEEQHFGRAARKMGLQQPPLSQQIKQLESILGYRLLDRNPRGATLTHAGQSLLNTTRRLMLDISEGIEEARRAAEGRIGLLTVGFSASLMSGPFPAIIRDYRSEYPDVTLRLVELTTSAQLEALGQKRIDLGFMRETEGGPSLISKPIFRERLVALLPRQHRLAKSKKFKVRDLAGEPFVLFPREVGSKFHDRITGVCRSAGFIPNVIQEAIEWYSIVRIVGAGVGVTIAPVSASLMCDISVVARPITPAEHTVVFMARRDCPIPSHVEGFIRSAERLTSS
jgi:DNA-binding transcriptional LysR family regulator